MALVGVNGAGKSNLLQAIRLLTQLAAGRFGRGPRAGTTPCNINVDFELNGKRVLYRARLSLSTESNREEVEDAREEWNFRGVDGRNRWIELPMRFFARYQRELSDRGTRRTPHGQALAAQHFFYVRRDLGRSFFAGPASGYAEAIAMFCNRISYYSASRFTNPSSCPSSFEIEADNTLRRPYAADSPSLEFLYDLYRCYVADQHLYSQFMSVVGSKGIALIDRIKWRVIKAPTRDFRVGPGGTVVKRMRERSIVIPQVSVKGVRLAPSQLSEGTFRSLALIFNLLSSKSELVLLEEPEVCVHHGLLSSLVEIIKTCAAKKQVIFSTHSDFILDSLDPENVLLVHYGPDAGTTARRLPEAIATREFASLKTYLRETGNLGEYWRQKGFA